MRKLKTKQVSDLPTVTLVDCVLFTTVPDDLEGKSCTESTAWVTAMAKGWAEHSRFGDGQEAGLARAEAQ